MVDTMMISYAGEENTANYRNIVNGYFAAFLVADNGVGAKAYGTDFGLSTGKYGLPAVEGNYSKHMQMLGQGGTGMAVWDNDNHGIYRHRQRCPQGSRHGNHCRPDKQRDMHRKRHQPHGRHGDRMVSH